MEEEHKKLLNSVEDKKVKIQDEIKDLIASNKMLRDEVNLLKSKKSIHKYDIDIKSLNSLKIANNPAKFIEIARCLNFIDLTWVYGQLGFIINRNATQMTYHMPNMYIPYYGYESDSTYQNSMEAN